MLFHVNSTKYSSLQPWPLGWYQKNLARIPLYPPLSITSSVPITGARSTLMATDKKGFISRPMASNKTHQSKCFKIVICKLPIPRLDFDCLGETSQAQTTQTSQKIICQWHSTNFCSQNDTGRRSCQQRFHTYWRWSNQKICRWWNWRSWVSHSKCIVANKQTNNWQRTDIHNIKNSILNDAQGATTTINPIIKHILNPHMLRARNQIDHFILFFPWGYIQLYVISSTNMVLKEINKMKQHFIRLKIGMRFCLRWVWMCSSKWMNFSRLKQQETTTYF